MATKKRPSPIFELENFLMPSYEKSPSFKVIACSVLEFRAIYWAGGGKHPLGANRVKGNRLEIPI